MTGTTKPAVALLILVLMVMSAVGFAMNSGTFQQEPQAPEIPTVIREPLTPDQEVQILRSGRVLIQHFYPWDCQECVDRNTRLEGFANSLEGYVVVNELVGNETKLEMIGWDPADPNRGKIVDISDSGLEREELLDVFCDIAIAQPRACIIRDL